MLEEPRLGSDGLHDLSDEWTSPRPGAFGIVVNRPGASLFLIEGDPEAGSARLDAAARARIATAAGCGGPSTGALPCYFLPATAVEGRRSLANWLRLPKASSQLVISKDYEVSCCPFPPPPLLVPLPPSWCPSPPPVLRPHHMPLPCSLVDFPSCIPFPVPKL